MSVPDLPPPELVTDERGMGRMLDDLARQDEIAVDTEADSFYSYREKVCLVQVTVEDRDYLIDPLADLDFGRFGPIFEDERKTKVFHDGEYDVLIMKREYDFSFAGLFDTRVAAATLGMEAPGLAAVLEHRFGVELDKSMQRSNWAERPLTERQIAYARLDTHFLLPLMRELRTELETRGRAMIVDGECRRLEKLVPPRLVFNPDEYIRLKGARALGPVERQALRELFILREQHAKEANVPPFRIMGNQAMLELARVRPRSVRKLTHINGFTPRMAKKIGDPVLDAIERAERAGPLEKMPVLPRRDGTDQLSEIQVELFERLKRLRKGVADEHGIESSYLLNRHVLRGLAQLRPKNRKELEGQGELAQWQVEMFGKGLLDVVADFERDVERGEVPSKRRSRRR